MSRSKYINTFNTTAEYDAYINSGYPSFPNVALDKEANKLKIYQQSLNNHLIYGEVIDINAEAPTFRFNNNNSQIITSHIDPLLGIFYIDQADITNVTQPIISLERMCFAQNNIKTLKKFNITTTNNTTLEQLFYHTSSVTLLNLSYIDTSSVRTMYNPFNGCNSLITLYLTGWDLSAVTNSSNIFAGCNNLTDVYISVEATLNRLTNNLTSQGSNYIPSSATIHYDNGSQVIDYKWQNNAWTAQS